MPTDSRLKKSYMHMYVSWLLHVCPLLASPDLVDTYELFLSSQTASCQSSATARQPVSTHAKRSEQVGHARCRTCIYSTCHVWNTEPLPTPKPVYTRDTWRPRRLLARELPKSRWIGSRRRPRHPHTMVLISAHMKNMFKNPYLGCFGYILCIRRKEFFVISIWGLLGVALTGAELAAGVPVTHVGRGSRGLLVAGVVVVGGVIVVVVMVVVVAGLVVVVTIALRL